MSTTRMKHINIGVQFTLCGESKKYVRIPEMNLACGGWEFSVNAIYIYRLDRYAPPEFIATYILPETEVFCKD